MCFYGSDSPSVFRQTCPVARKAHRCCECAQPIAIGQKYERTEGCWDREWSTYYTCEPCANARELMTELEEAAGCHDDEAFCPFHHLAEAASEYDRDTRDALTLWADLADRRVLKAEAIAAFTRVAPRLIKEARAHAAEQRRLKEEARARSSTGFLW